MQTYKVVDQQVEIAREVLDDHKRRTETELVSDEATQETWEDVEERERELATIKHRLSEEIAKYEEVARSLTVAKETETRIMEINKELVEFMEEERDRVQRELRPIE